MKLDEFMAALSESEHEWVVSADGHGAIRDERALCPICSLAADRGWVVPGSDDDDDNEVALPNEDWLVAAESIGLSAGLAGMVANAADHGVYVPGVARFNALTPGTPSAIVRVRLEKALKTKAPGA